jgi:AcrR family transcriptional regulator
MGSTSRTTKSDVVSDFRRTQILDAARAAFGRHGVAKTTVDGIAKSAGLAKGTVYLYYKSKDEILRQILAEDLRALHDTTLPIVRSAEPLEDRLQGFFRATLEFFDHRRDFFDQCYLEMTPDERKKTKQQLGVVFAAQAEAWQEGLRAAARSGAVRIADIAGASRGIVSLAHGLAIQRLRGWYTGSIDESVAWTSALLLKGLTAK